MPKPKEKGSHNLKQQASFVFPFLSAPLRILYAVITIIIGGACLFIYYEQQSLPIFGIIFLIIGIGAVVYQDEWMFFPDEQRIRYRIGLAGITHKKHYTFDDVMSVETDEFTRGVFFKRPIIKGILMLKNGDKKTVCIFYPEWEKTMKKNWESIESLFTHIQH